MSNLATPEAGASVVLATCSDDDRHPPGCAIDGNPGTCWVTTGMFPQELVVRLGKQTPVSRVKTLTTKVKGLALEYSEGPQPDGFKPVFEVTLPDKGGDVQTETHQFTAKATFIKLRVASGYDDFASVHSIEVFS